MRVQYARMKNPMQQGRPRQTRSTNLSLNASLVDEAKSLGVNLSAAANAGVEEAVMKRRAEKRLVENSSALESYNSYVVENGLPLEKLRLF